MELDVVKIVNKHRRDRGSLISILEEIQSFFGYLPADALKIVADRTNRSLVDVYGVATFYRAFSLKPRGKHLVSACLGTACHVRGAPRVAEELQAHLQVKPGETTADKEFTLEIVNCLGACALGPIVVVDGHYFSNVTTSQVPQILKRAGEGLARVDGEPDEQAFPIQVGCPRCYHSLMDEKYPIDGHSSIKMMMIFEQRQGWIRLSSVYTSHGIESEYPIMKDTVVHFFCPHCNAELIGPGRCYECESPMVPLAVQGGAVIQFCSRRGCKVHLLDLHDMYFS